MSRKRSRTLIPISNAFKKAIEYMDLYAVAPERLRDEKIQDDIQQLAFAAADKLRSPDKEFPEYEPLDDLTEQIIEARANDTTLDIELEELLGYICVAEAAAAISAANEQSALDEISEQVESNKEYYPTLHQYLIKFSAARSADIKKYEEDAIRQLSYEQLQKYLINPNNKLLEFAKTLQNAIIADRKLPEFQQLSDVNLIEEYWKAHAIVAYGKNASKFDNDYSINLDRADRLFVTIIQHFKKDTAKLITQHADDETLYPTLQPIIMPIFEFYWRAVKSQSTYDNVLRIIEQINNTLAFVFTHVISKVSSEGLISARSKPETDANTLAKSLQSIVTELANLGMAQDPRGTLAASFQAFTNGLTNLEYAIVFMQSKIEAHTLREVPFDKIQATCEAFVTHFTSVMKCLQYIQEPYMQQNKQQIIDTLSTILVSHIRAIARGYSFEMITDDELSALIDKLDSLTKVLHGQHLQILLRSLTVLQHDFIDRIKSKTFQEPDERAVHITGDPTPMITKNTLVDFIERKNEEYRHLIDYERTAESVEAIKTTELYKLVNRPGYLVDNRLAKDVNIVAKYYQSILEYAESQLTPRASGPKFRL